MTNLTKSYLQPYKDWWQTLSSFQRFLPALLIAMYWLALLLLNGFRNDHLAVGIIILVLSYGGPFLRIFLKFLMPLILTTVVYDSQRFYGDYIRGRIRISEPYLFDKRFFGIQTSQGVLTPNEWFQLHVNPILDLIFGFYYLGFIAIFVMIAAYFYFYVSRKGTKKMSAEQVRIISPRVMWAFFWLNIIGYSTYYWYPAAPPWYVSLYGLGPAHLEALPNAAGCLRLDELLGTNFFTSMYGRSADVFGAIPSLHVAYPLLAVYYSLKIGAARAFSILFYIMMCLSAVYLNHHYVLDVIWGSAYAIIIAVTYEWWANIRIRSNA